MDKPDDKRIQVEFGEMDIWGVPVSLPERADADHLRRLTAGAMLNSGHWEDAESLLAEIHDPGNRARAYLETVSGLVLAGDEEIAEKIRDKAPTELQEAICEVISTAKRGFHQPASP